MPIVFFPQLAAGQARWGSIGGSVTDQNDLIAALASKADADHGHDQDYEPLNPAIGAHLADTGNPHCVDKAQVGLSDVDNAPQIKRSAGDIALLPEKPAPGTDDILMIEDSDDFLKKKKLKISALSDLSSGMIIKAADETYSEPLLRNDSHLFINMQAGRKCAFGLVLHFTVTAPVQLKLKISVPAGTECRGSITDAASEGTVLSPCAVYTDLNTEILLPASGSRCISIEGYIQAGTDGGSIQLMWAPKTSDSLTLKAGSRIWRQF